MQILANLDLVRNELQNARIQNLAAAPANPQLGLVYFNTTDNKYYGWAGSWVELSQVYTHPTGDGNLHVPATGTSNNGKVLKAGSTAGSLSWSSLSKSDVGLGSVDNTADSAKNVLSATKLTTARTLTISGDVDGSTTFDGSANATISVSLDTTGVSAGTYKSVTVDTKGRVTAGTNPTTLSGHGITDAVKNGGSTPELRSGLESARPSATGSGAVYFATDTKKIWKDTASGTWTQMGGQESFDWDSITGKPSTFTPPVASTTVLGGIKVGANLTVTADGVLNANDNPASFIRRQERFTVGSQTVFTLTKGSYQPNTGAMTWFLNGDKQDDRALTESSSTTVTLPAGLSSDDEVLFEYYEVINWHPFPTHASEHLTGGADPIPLATATADGLMSSTLVSKLNGIEAGAEVNDPAFKTIAVSGQSSVVADTDADTLTFAAGSNVQITTNASTDTVTISATDTTYSVATTGANGLMSSGDKTKLDGIATNANNYSHPTGDGNLHVPATGTGNNGKFLKAGSTAGSLSWSTLAAGDIPTLTLAKISDSGTAATKDTGTASGNVPILDSNGKLDTNVLPALAISDTFVVASQTAMLALTAEPGDVAVRTDLNKSFILKTAGAATLANWQELLTPTDAVSSVAGKTGAVTLTSSDVGLGNVANESKATMFTSPALTGTPTAPTAATATNNTQIATTAFVKAQGYITSSGAPVQSVAGRTGAVTLSKTDVGLGSVENKSSATIRGEIISSNVTTALGYTPAQKKTATIGDGTNTQFTVTHNLNTQDITVTVRESAAPFSVVFADVQMTDVNNIKVLFGAAPTSGQYTVVVTG